MQDFADELAASTPPCATSRTCSTSTSCRREKAELEAAGLRSRPVGRPGQGAAGHLAAVLRPGRDQPAGAAARSHSTTPGCCWSSAEAEADAGTSLTRSRPEVTGAAQGRRGAGGPHPAVRRVRLPRGAGEPSGPVPAAWTRPTSPRCCCGCTCAGPSGTATRPRSTTPRTPRRRASSRRPSRSRRRTRTARCRVEARHPPAGPDQPVRQPGPAADQFRRGRGRAGGRADRRDRHPGGRHPGRRLPLVRPGWPGRQHHRLGGAAHPHPDRHRGHLPERAVASCRTRRPR